MSEPPIMNNSKGVNAILRGTAQGVTKKKRKHQYTVQEKASMITLYDCSPHFHGNLKQFNDTFSVKDGFLQKARKTISKLKSSQVKTGILVRLNGPEMEFNIKRKTISVGRSVKYPAEEDWLYLQFQLYETHEISLSTAMLISLVVGKYPQLSSMTEDRLSK